MVVGSSSVCAQFRVSGVMLVLITHLVGCSDLAQKPNNAGAGADARISETGAVVDEQGGQLKLADLASLTIPRGAVLDTAQIKLAAVESPVSVASRVSNVLALTPHGTEFEVPVKVSLKYKSTKPPSSLAVVRLADEQDSTWEVVGGAEFEAGFASFETTSFSYYAVVEGFACEPVPATNTPCGGSCSDGTFCSSNKSCVDLTTTDLCANNSLYVIRGELPPDLVNIDEKQRSDGIIAQQLVGSWAGKCGLTPTTVSQAEPGILDPCTDAPLLGAGTTLVVVGGTWGQRAARFLDRNLAPVVGTYDATAKALGFVTRSGEQLISFPEANLSPTRDYFVVQVLTEPVRGALIVYLYGLGWEGTPAGAWYFSNVLYPEITNGGRWPKYLVVEWLDDGDGLKGATDTFNVIAKQ